MVIERRNILDIIGKHRGKYHSCILTCYSLDFSFFEERVLPVLRVANVKNVNVFADGKFLEVAQQNTTGKEFRTNKTYSFLPIYTKGVFHPKIMLLTGVKQGLLIIGSGNITSSGLNTNDEIWGAFHLDTVENENAPLFAEVWNYLQQFLKQANGFLHQKIAWIRKYSPWLEQLPKNVRQIEIRSLKQTISFIYNSDEQSIYKKILFLIPKGQLTELTIISPYYDANGKLISDLYKHYSPLKMNCVVDTDFGLLPANISDDIKESIKFYDWKDCKDDYNLYFHRLHAKIFSFQYQDGTEYFILGSANATDAAMGTNIIHASNAEAGIVIKRTESSRLFEELEIRLPLGKAIDLKTYRQNNHILFPPEEKKIFKIKISYSELKGNELSIYLKEETTASGILAIYSHDSILIESISFQSSKGNIIVECKHSDDLFKVCLRDESGNRTSTYSITHRWDYLIKCNPDPEHAKLNELLEKDFPDGEGYTELLRYVDYNWADEEAEKNIRRGNDTNKQQEKAEIEKKYEKLSASDFNKVSTEILLKQAGELTSANIKIADFLHLISSDLFHRSEEPFKESEEQKQLLNKEQKGEGEEVPPSKKENDSGIIEQKAIAFYLKKLNEQYTKRLAKFFKARSLTESPNEEISIKNLSSILIAFQLIQIYWDKQFTIKNKTEYEIELEDIQASYLTEGDIKDPCTVKGFIIGTFGKFLLLATGKFKVYDYDILTQKLKANRGQVFMKAIFVLLNLSWTEKETDYRDTLLLNSLYFLNPGDPSNDFLQELLSQLEKYKLSSKHQGNAYEKNYANFVTGLFPRYCKWFETFSSKEMRKTIIADTGRLNSGNYIFSSKVGFNLIAKKSENKNKLFLSLKRAGYIWEEEKQVCILENIEYPPKSIVFM